MDETKDYLFVGGPFDGRWMATDGRPIAAPVFRDNSIYALDHLIDSMLYAPMIETVIYKTMAFAGNKQRFDIYIPEGMSSDQAVKRLIEGYRKTEPAECA